MRLNLNRRRLSQQRKGMSVAEWAAYASTLRKVQQDRIAAELDRQAIPQWLAAVERDDARDKQQKGARS